MSRQALPIKPQSVVLDEDKAWLLGHLAGDGRLNSRLNKEGARSNANVKIWVGLDKALGDECVRLFASVYGVPAKNEEREPDRPWRKNLNWEVVCYRKAVADDVLSYAPFGRYVWRIPQVVMEGGRRIKGAWLSGFFDADGTTGIYRKNAHGRPRQRVLSASSSNAEGLRQVQALLSEFGIETRWDRVNQAGFVRSANPTRRFPHYRLWIGKRESIIAFAGLVRFRGEKKTRLLDELLESYREDRTSRKGPHAGKLSEVLALKARGKSLTEIAQALRFKNQHRVQDFLQRAARRGEIVRFERSDGYETFLPRIIEMRRQGKKWGDIGWELGHSGLSREAATYAKGIAAWARKKSLWPEELTEPRGLRLNENRLPKIAEMRASGASWDEIGEALGFKGENRGTMASNIVQWAKKKGLWPPAPNTPSSTGGVS